jgi:type III restriction enzyme
VKESSIAQLTVISNESYREFADSLQREYKAAGVSIGFVRKEEFSKIPDIQADGAKVIGFENSTKLWDHLNAQGMIDKEGRVLPSFAPQNLDFTLNLPEDYKPYESSIIEIVRTVVERFIKQARNRQQRTLNSEVLWSQDFEDFWNGITKRTTY